MGIKVADKIRLGIVGYGNIGQGAEIAINATDDMRLEAVFSRRGKDRISLMTEGVPVFSPDHAPKFKGSIDVMLMCGGSATDLPVQTPRFAPLFNLVDSFDTHANMHQHFCKTHQAALTGGKTAIIGAGWDPGLFSLLRLFVDSVLPGSRSDTFWGPGLSQGHSDALRRIPGVKAAVQYTIPIPAALSAAREGVFGGMSAQQKHLRQCYIVAEDRADRDLISQTVRTMPDYFAGYKTEIHFVSPKDLEQNHAGKAHGGKVIGLGSTGLEAGNRQSLELALDLEHNAQFTASVMVAYARAAHKMNSLGLMGAHTVFDVPLSHLSPQSRDALHKKFL